MAERYPERNWEQTGRERETWGEERHQGRPSWRQGAYGASLAQEMPFYGTEPFVTGQGFQQPYGSGMQQQFPGQLQQPYVQGLQPPFIHQQYGYPTPFQPQFLGPQQQMPYGMQQPYPIQQAQGLQPQYAMGIPQQQPLQQPIPGIQQPFAPPIQQPFLQQAPGFSQMQQPPIGFNQPTPQAYPQQIQGQPLQQLQRGRFLGRGPKNYKRPDERIREDAIERLTTHPDIDATNVDITVKNGEVTLKGTVEDRLQKRLVEDIVETVFGVTDVQNQLRVETTQWNQFQHTGMEKEELTTRTREK